MWPNGKRKGKIRTGQGWLRRAEDSLFSQHHEGQRVLAELGVIADRRQLG